MKNYDNPLDPMRKSQEDEYFRKQNAELALKLKQRIEMTNAGVKDEALADALSQSGFNEDSIRVLYFVPLVEIAWADHEVQFEEKKQIFEVATGRGITTDSRAYQILKAWLEQGLEDPVFKKAKTLLDPFLSEVKKSNSTDWLLKTAEGVASATGGLFGLGFGKKTSAEEEKLIRRLSEKLKK